MSEGQQERELDAGGSGEKLMRQLESRKEQMDDLSKKLVEEDRRRKEEERKTGEEQLVRESEARFKLCGGETEGNSG